MIVLTMLISSVAIRILLRRMEKPRPDVPSVMARPFQTRGYLMDTTELKPKSQTTDGVRDELREADQFAMIRSELMDRQHLVHMPAQVVYLRLVWMAGHRGSCFPSLAYLSEKTGLGITSVKTGLTELIAIGLIAKESRRSPTGRVTSNTYVIKRGPIFPPQQEPSDDHDDGDRSRETAMDRSRLATTNHIQSINKMDTPNGVSSHNALHGLDKVLVTWWMERHGLRQIANWPKEMATAKKLLAAGLDSTNGEADHLFEWVRDNPYWRMKQITLGVMLSQYNAWRAAGSPARSKEYVPDV